MTIKGVQHSALTFSMIVLIMIVWSHAGQNVFQPENDVVIMNVDNFPAIKSWQVVTSAGGRTGTFYHWRGEHFGAELRPPAGTELEYRFNITTPGEYHLRIYNYIPEHQNDCFINIDDRPVGEYQTLEEHLDVGHSSIGTYAEEWETVSKGTWLKYFSRKGTYAGKWSWSAVFHPVKIMHDLSPSFVLEAGEHVLKIGPRTPRFVIDRIAIVHESKIGDISWQPVGTRTGGGVGIRFYAPGSEQNNRLEPGLEQYYDVSGRLFCQKQNLVGAHVLKVLCDGSQAKYTYTLFQR